MKGIDYKHIELTNSYLSLVNYTGVSCVDNLFSTNSLIEKIIWPKNKNKFNCSDHNLYKFNLKWNNTLQTFENYEYNKWNIKKLNNLSINDPQMK